MRLYSANGEERQAVIANRIGAQVIKSRCMFPAQRDSDLNSQQRDPHPPLFSPFFDQFRAEQSDSNGSRPQPRETQPRRQRHRQQS